MRCEPGSDSCLGRRAERYRPIALLATAWVFSYSLNAQELKASPPNLDLILDSLERTEEQNPASLGPTK